MPKSTAESTAELYRRYLKVLPYPDLFDEFGENVERSRGEFARWMGVRREEISFQPNSSTSQNLVVSMVAPKRGENMVVDDLGFPSGTYPLIASRRRGIGLRWVRNRKGLITAKDYESAIDRKTKLVIVSLVSWVNGLRAEVEEIAKIAHERGALCMVDSTHGTGYLELDLHRSKIDFLATSNYKWLLSPHGTSEFYCAKGLMEELEPPHLGWHSVPGGPQGLSAEKMDLEKTAKRFEPGNPDYISIQSLTFTLRMMSRFGRDRISERTLKLSAMVNEGLRDLGLGVMSPGDEPHLSAITFARPKLITGDELAGKLRKRRIIVTPRSYHGRSGIRVSPYFYNDEGDVTRFLEAVKEIIRNG